MKASRNLIQSLLLGVAMLPVLVQAQFVCVTNNGAITIAKYTGSGGAVVIPDTTNGWPVISIGNGAFYQCANLHSVTIPGSVTNIGNGAFAFCGSLTSVTIPDSITNIGAFTFYACSNLASARISTNVTSIGVSAFDSCTGLTNVTIPNGVINIGGSAFQNCTALTNVLIPNGVINIGSSAFQNCTALTSVTIPANVTNFGPDAFGSCGNLQAITVDPQNTNFSSLDGVLIQILFNGYQTVLIQYPAGKAGNYTVPNSVTSIGDFAFDSCTGLANITIPNGVTSIGNWAFDSCFGLTNVTIGNIVSLPDGAISIGGYAFESCSSLVSVTICYDLIGRANHPFDGCTSLTDVTIYAVEMGPSPDWSRFFPNCPNLTSIYLAGDYPSFVWNPTNQIATPTVYCLPGASLSSVSGLPTALWLPQVQDNNASFGIQTNQFGFNINWASRMTVVIEACLDLANPVWTPVGTNTLASGSIYFSDSQWTNYTGRFYRVHGLNVFGQ